MSRALRFPSAAARRNAVTVASWSAEPTLTRGQRQLATGGNGRFQLSLNGSALHLAVAGQCHRNGTALALSYSVSAVCWAAASIEIAALALLAF